MKKESEWGSSILGAVFVCLLLNGCAKVTTKHTHFTVINQQEAKLTDIPIPLYDEWLSIVSSSENIQGDTIFGYRSKLSADTIIDFYVHEMERLGWQERKLFQGKESLIQFESPERFCSISIRSNNGESKKKTGTTVIIFLGKK